MLMQGTLFDDRSPANAGFRLAALEVYNWGTFHDRIWTVPTDACNALLTGANGSGKSTLVDTLLTLLVPNNKRNYNLSSGSSKRERSERTYVLGAFGNLKDESASQAKTQYLRDKASYSVILARFADMATDELITLAQVFWTENDSLHKFFVVAERSLGIQADFCGLASPGEIRKALRRQGVEIHQTFSDYISHFRRRAGLKSDKALDLFNQVVAIKEVGRLNEFIRDHMLERFDVAEPLDELYVNFQNLELAHQAILRAKDQLKDLAPIAQDAESYDKTDAALQTSQGAAQALPAYFAERELALISEETARIEAKQNETRNLITEARRREEDLAREVEQLRAAINQDETGQHIQGLEREIAHCEERKSRKLREAERYGALAKGLELDPEPASELFYKTLNDLKAQTNACDAKLHEIQEKLYAVRAEAETNDRALRESEAELASLRGRKTKLPAFALSLRSRLAEHLGIGDDELPFVAELIQVKAEASTWESAIERLLRGFGLRLLVPDAHYQQATTFVNSQHLGERLVYYRVRDDDAHGQVIGRRVQDAASNIDVDHLFFKLDFREDSPFALWVQDQVLHHFDYVCTDDLTRFHRETRALTAQGLVKKAKILHEKDDRFALNDHRRFILGWDNSAKIRVLEEVVKDLGSRSKDLARKYAGLEKNRSELDTRRMRLHDLSAFTDFASIDWRPDALAIESLKERIQALAAKATHLKRLRADLEKLQARLQEARKKVEDIVKEQGRLETEAEGLARERERAETLLASYRDLPYQEHAARLDSVAKRLGRKISGTELAAIRGLRDKVRQFLDDEQKAQQERRHRLEQTLTQKMTQFINRFPEEAKDLAAGSDGRREFLKLRDKIAKDALPGHEKRFKSLLNKNVVNDMASFKSSLEREEEEIRASVRQLNDSLKTIDYGKSTYVQLVTEWNRDTEVVGFRQMLRDCMPDVGLGDDERVYEDSFFKIKTMIGRLKDEERWRKKVTDVRNWLDFSAVELFREDDAQCRYYSDSGGLSGGQKAKLAFTILASGIAYQYGLHASEARSRSFRFVVIDEAFSKSDEVNARYAMQLFEKLGLQLMVVTPLDKIHVVEPYIKRIHFVHNNATFSDSKVQTLTIDEYREERERAEGQGLTGVIAELPARAGNDLPIS